MLSHPHCRTNTGIKLYLNLWGGHRSAMVLSLEEWCTSPKRIGFNYKRFSACCLKHHPLNHTHSEMGILTQRYFCWEDTFKLLRNLKAGQERIMPRLSGKCWQNLKYIAVGIEQAIAVLSWGGLGKEEKGEENRGWNLNSSVKLSASWRKKTVYGCYRQCKWTFFISLAHVISVPNSLREMLILSKMFHFEVASHLNLNSI